MNQQMLDALAEGLADETRLFVSEALKPLVVRVKTLEAAVPALLDRIKNLETSHATREMELRDVPRFSGSYQSGKQYVRGEWCVHGGSTWACLKDTSDAPGNQTDAWMIAARRGREKAAS